MYEHSAIDRTETSSTTRSLLDRWTVCILLAVAAFQFWAAQHYTVFDDEAFSCRRYALPLGKMVSQLHDGVEPDPPLFYILENLWVHTFGVGPLALRSLPILIFLAGLIAIRAAASQWFDRRTGIAAMLLCALHPAHLFFGMAARWYGTMFSLVALLLWLIARIANVGANAKVSAKPPPSLGAASSHTARDLRNLFIAWTLVATAILYTNYFGVVLVALIALVAPARKKTLPCLIFVAILFAPWLEAFWREWHNFPPQPTYVATAQRTFATLLAGNLADSAAWWVWVPMGIFAIGIAILTIIDRHRVGSLALIVLGSLIAAVASRTMIDKYVMALSGPAVMLVAALMVRTQFPSRGFAKLQNVAITCLFTGWLGCTVNLIREKNWSSLRWLDPFEQAIKNAVAQDVKLDPHTWIITHTSARYYLACLAEARRRPESLSVNAGAWVHVSHSPDDWMCKCKNPCYISTPESASEELETHPMPEFTTVQSASFADSGWNTLEQKLTQHYSVIEEKKYLEDPNAAEKDRIDPRFSHPKWRITVRRWKRR